MALKKPANDLSLNSRLDYCGIALLIMGSFVPWLYYGFYCHYKHKLIYLTVVIVLGITSIITSLWDKFSQPNLRPLRAGKFKEKTHPTAIYLMESIMALCLRFLSVR